MKKIFTIFVLAFSLLCIQTVEAQKTVTKKKKKSKRRPVEQYEFGFKLGYNYAKASAENITNLKSLSGLQVGFFGIKNLNRDFSLQAELLYSQKGFKEKNNPSVTHTYSLNYFDVPIMFNYKFRIERGLYASLYAGPSFGYLLSANYLEESDNADDREIDLGDIINKFDMGFVLGVSTRTEFEDIGEFLFDIRYYGICLTTIDDQDKDFEDKTLIKDATNNVVSLSIGYFF